MSCFKPLEAWRSPLGDIVFKPLYTDRPSAGMFKLPCGQCIGCRLARSSMWATRCVHEAQLHKQNCFITLTYNDDNLPYPPTLSIRPLQLFMKRLRKRFGAGIRFYACGEYGEKFGRPHYHACIFGFDFPDKKLWKISNGFNLFVSDALAALWPYGYAVIGDVTFESAAYVARYIMKKITGDRAEAYYSDRVDLRTGEIYNAKPEFTVMSRRPGIAHDWFVKYGSDVYPHDYVVLRNGKKLPPPRYYDGLFEAQFPGGMTAVKAARVERALLHIDNNTEERLAIREELTVLRLNKLVRPVD